MSARSKLKHELKTLGMTTLFFGCWIAALLAIKSLVYNSLAVIRQHMGEGGACAVFAAIATLEPSGEKDSRMKLDECEDPRTTRVPRPF